MKIKGKTRKKTGITIISLVLTIIILLILAGITIASITGDNGILKNASNAKEQTKIEEEKEILRLSTIQAIGNDKSGNIEEEKLKKELNNYIGEKNYNLEGEGPFKMTYNDTQNSYIIKNDGTIEKYYEVSYLKEGDYVKYEYDNSENYTLTTNSSIVSKADVGYAQTIVQDVGMKWRIFNIDDLSGTIELISEKPTNNTLVLRSSIGYINGVNILNNICENQYSNKKLNIKARSITIEDIYSKMNSLGLEYVKNNTSNTKVWENVVIPTLALYENGLAVNSNTIKTDGLNRSDSYDFDISSWWVTNISTLTLTDTFVSYDDSSLYFDNQTIYDMIFGCSKYYWTASRYVSSTVVSSCAAFGIISVGNKNLLNAGALAGTSYYNKANYSRCIRPIITIKTEMLNNDCKKNNEGEWILDCNS